MPDFYRDTLDRVRNDPTFHQALMLLVGLAEQHGYTPWELKQVAFAAAVYVEQRCAKPLFMRIQERELSIDSLTGVQRTKAT